MLHYTIQSVNEDNYATIETCLEAPPMSMTKLTVTGLTTLCSMILLDTNDYLEIDGTKYHINDTYTDLNSISVAELLTKTLDDISISVAIDNSNRLRLTRNQLHEEEEEFNENEFTITGALYYMKQVMGLYKT